MSKGVQIAGGATLIALLLGWYAATNLDGGLAFTYYETLDEFLAAAGGHARPHVARARLRRAAARSSATSRPSRCASRSQNEPAARRRRARGTPLAVVFASLETPDLFKDGAEVVVEGRLVERRVGARLPRRQGPRQVPLEVRGRGHRADRAIAPSRRWTPDVRARRHTPCASPLPVIALLGLGGAASTPAAPRRPEWTRVAERSVLGRRSRFVSLAMVALFAAFATYDFQLAYVAAHSARSMALPYRLAALWGGQAGSLLLWLWMLTAYGAACVVVQPAPEPHADALGRRRAARQRHLLPGAAQLRHAIPSSCCPPGAGALRRQRASTRCSSTR